MKTLLKFSMIILLIFQIGCSQREKKILDTNQYDSELSGSISGVLEKFSSPYYVIDNIVVDSSNSLVIEPGVRLLFYDSTYLEIKGGLSSIGEPSNPITFTSYDNNWGGIRIINSSQPTTLQFVIIENVLIYSIDTTYFAAISVYESSAIIQNSMIQKNDSDNGGGLFLQNADVKIKNNIFRNNNASTYGGAILAISSSTAITNNTFFKNTCMNYGGSLVLIDPLTADIQNNIFFKNSSRTGDPRISIISGDVLNYTIEYNFMWYGDLDPKFISDDDLHLQVVSPCIDAGNPAAEFNDLDGSRNDQGAYGGPAGNF